MKINNKFLISACTNCGLCDYKMHHSFNNHNKKNFIINVASKQDYFQKICPGLGLNFSNQLIDDKDIKYHPLIGSYYNSYVGYSENKTQRLSSSSGGALTEIIVYLLETNEIDAVAMPLAINESGTEHSYALTNDIDLIRKSSQSIYTKIPAWGILDKIFNYNGRIAFVGLPDQTASLRMISKEDKTIRNKIKYFLGPMVGICMDKDVIAALPSILNQKNGEIKNLRWRDGEWPGSLNVKIDKKEHKISKFHYNYFLPFYCSHESLLSDDFSNEFADISVGDAWSPKYEKLGLGWGLIWSKNMRGDKILQLMLKAGRLSLNKVPTSEAISMHEHMLDFKKRGSKYRAKIYNFFGYPTKKYFSQEPKYAFSRWIIEFVILGAIVICRTKIARALLPYMGQKLMGYLFSVLRINWKKLTKNIKRQGLESYGK